MKRRKILYLLLALATLCVALFLAIRGLLSPTALSSEKALSLYEKATVSSPLHPNTYSITLEKTILLGETPITEIHHQTIRYSNKDSDDFSVTVSEVTTIGEHSFSSTEAFRDSTLYCTLDADAFSGPMSQDVFLARYAPFSLIDPTLYSQISGIKDRNIYTLNFSGGISPETWADVQGEFQNSEGTVTLNTDGLVTEYRYTCEFIANGIQQKLAVTTILCADEHDIVFCEDQFNFKPISDPTAPKQLELACGYLLAATNVESTYKDEIYCQAFDDRRTQLISLSAAADHTQVNTSIALENRSKVGGVSEITKEEYFKDGQYLISINDSEPVNDPEITAEKMRRYCQNILIGTILLPEHIASATVTSTDSSVRYSFEGNEQFSDTLRSNACETLYQDPEILTAQTQSYTTESASFYLELDIQTGIPLASGFFYEGIYSTDGLPYRLMYCADQSYQLK